MIKYFFLWFNVLRSRGEIAHRKCDTTTSPGVLFVLHVLLMTTVISRMNFQLLFTFLCANGNCASDYPRTIIFIIIQFVIVIIVIPGSFITPYLHLCPHIYHPTHTSQTIFILIDHH